jgi:uncharacterized membrane-anchored protein YjiN (DUF445 family)
MLDHMKQQGPALLAPLLLLLALILLALAEFMGAAGIWAWVKAGAEAAAVGGMADWFAVVVLFRHPLGIPIPHSAIVPKSKARIADSMAEFVHDHFLQRDKLLAKLADFNVARHLGEWLQQAMQVQHFVQGVRQMLLDALHTLDDAPIRLALTDALTTQAQRWNAASTLGQALDLVTKDNRHQQVLNMGLEKVAALLKAPQVGEFLGQQIHEFLKKDYPKIHWAVDALHSAADLSRSAADKLRDAVLGYLQAVLSNPAHPHREDFSQWVTQYMGQLRTDADMQKDFNDTKDRLVQSPEVRDFLSTVWTDVKSRLMTDLASDDSSLALHAERALQGLGQRLASDEGLRQSVNHYFEQVAGQLADQLSQGIPKHIAETIKAWDDQQLVQELERSVGRDLQFIRINGTLVGAALGLGFYGLHWLGNLA